VDLVEVAQAVAVAAEAAEAGRQLCIIILD
jgi:hypothetical protein